MRSVTAFDFGIDYGVNVFTMAPFYLMANALALGVIEKTGFLWFFLSYCFLIVFGLTLLIVREVYRLVRSVGSPLELRGLQAFWMIMNSGMLITMVLIFMAFRWWGDACPLKGHDGHVPSFVALFGLLVFIRDYVDFTRAWPILYPVDPTTHAGRSLFPVTLLKNERSVCIGKVLGSGLVAALIVLIFLSGLWRVPDLARACAL